MSKRRSSRHPHHDSPPHTTLPLSDAESDSDSDANHALGIENRLSQFDRAMANARKSAKAASTAAAPPPQHTGGGFKGGEIESIELVNFMCHAHLRVDLRESVNFIVGNNGSGKSAILTALTICLGARAKSTDRGSSAESLIREGAAEARVTIKLANTSSFPFRAELYGNAVLVERRIRRGAAGSYRTRSGDGKKIISDRKDEINALCDHYNIQVTNPLVILTQDTAKRFLVNSTPAHLYAFFMEATNLKQMTADFADADARIKKMEAALSETKTYWPEKEAAIDNLAMQLEGLEHVRDSQRKIASLQAEVAWSKVVAAEKAQSAQNDALSAARERLSRAEKSASDCETAMHEHRLAIHQQEEDYHALLRQKNPIRMQREELKAAIASRKQQYQQLEEISKEINTEVASRRKILQTLQTKIDEELEKENNDNFLQIKQTLEEKENEIVTLNHALSQNTDAKTATADQHAQLTHQLASAKRQHADLKLAVANDEAGLADAQAAEANKLRAYGATLPEAMDDINAAAPQFKHKPIGPIGAYITLKDQKWALPLSAIIGSNLGSFITTSHDDRIRLQEIFRRHRCHNQIIVISPTAIDISRGIPGPDYLTALNVLEVGHELVRKALITMTGLERIVLSENRPWAMNLIGVERPQNIDAAYTLQHRITATANATISTALYMPASGNPFESSRERIRLLTHRIRENTQRLTTCERDVRALHAQIDDCNAQHDQIRTKHAALLQQLTRLKNECRELEDKLGESDKVALAEYEKERISVQRQIDRLAEQFADHYQNMLVEKEAVERVEQQIHNLNLKEQEITLKTESIQTHIRDMSDERRDIEHKLAQAKIAAQHATAEIEGCQKLLAQGEQQLAILQLEAGRLSKRVSTRRSVTAIENEILRLQDFVARNSASNLNHDAVSAELEHMKAELQRSVEYYAINKRLLDSFKKALHIRKQDWSLFILSIAESSNQSFISSLQSRGFRGSLDYDHVKFTLGINVQVDHPDSDHEAPARTDIRQLSGGEKSFGTACFLLSLWQAMGCPFRCLDEFDVFMDAVNRQLVIEMLLVYAREIKCQMILITPGSVRGYLREEDAEHVHMVMMKNPERTQNHQ